MRRTSGWGGWPRCCWRADRRPLFRPAGTLAGHAHGSLRRPLRLDVAFRLASGHHLSRPGNVPPPAFGGRIRDASSGRLDGARSDCLRPSRRRCRPRAGALFAFHVTLNTWAYSRLRALVRPEPGLSGAGSRACVRAASERGLLAVSGARRARPHVAQQRFRRARGAGGRGGSG